VAVAVAAAATGGALVWTARVPCDLAALDYRDLASVVVTARDGSPLRTTLGPAETRATWTPLAEISPYLVEATLAAEDRRFRRHPGVDLIAAARAAWDDLRAGRIVSGGSTLTQQLAGMLWPEPRTAGGKLREAVRALRLEHRLTKDRILEQYLNRVPYGNGIQGVGEAASRYFDRSPAALDAARAATLAALPQAPSRLADPASAPRLRARRNAILRAMAARGALTAEEAARAEASPLALAAGAPAFRAPHFADWILAGRPVSAAGAARLVTTLDPVIQEDVERTVAAALARRGAGDSSQVAVVVLDVASGEILAMTGSTSWGDPDEGQVNGATSLRQPGSALKPFLYTMGFDRGLSPADLLADVPFHAGDEDGGDVAPQNYDGCFHGPVRAREALASSFNVPAVRLQDAIGTPRVLEGLRAAGLASIRDDPERYGLGLTLGVGEVTLLDLTAAYAGLARGGVFLPAVFLRAALDSHDRSLPLREGAARRWCTPASAFLVADVLADDAARIPGFGGASVLDLPFPVAVKTGTSTGYRDSWCLGFDRDRAVGVWTGNFSGRPLRGLPGSRSAGPVFREIMLRLHERGSRPWSAEPPPGWRLRPVCALSGDVPGPACGGTVLEWFTDRDYARRPTCTFHRLVNGRRVTVWPPEYAAWARENGLAGGTQLAAEVPASTAGPEGPRSPAAPVSAASRPRILSPQEGNVYYLDPTLGPGAAIRFAGLRDAGAAWILDGRELGRRGDLFWTPERGEHVLVLRTPEGSDRVRFTVR
jgi:penicillin-binding protein 1C